MRGKGTGEAGKGGKGEEGGNGGRRQGREGRQRGGKRRRISPPRLFLKVGAYVSARSFSMRLKTRNNKIMRNNGSLSLDVGRAGQSDRRPGDRALNEGDRSVMG